MKDLIIEKIIGKFYRFGFIFSLIPYAWIVAFYLFVIRAVYVFGYLPEFPDPDPGRLGFDLHHELVESLFWLSFYMTIINLIAVMFIYIPFRKYRNMSSVFGYLFLCTVMFAVDPGGCVEWYAN
jgi:hypothetical protein